MTGQAGWSEVLAEVLEFLIPVVGVLADLLFKVFDDPLDFVGVEGGVVVVFQTPATRIGPLTSQRFGFMSL